MRALLVFDRDEIEKVIPYKMICETRYGAFWETSRRRRLWTQLFTESERKAASKLFKQAHRWHLVRGLPNEHRMSPSTYRLWCKLAEFCASL